MIADREKSQSNLIMDVKTRAFLCGGNLRRVARRFECPVDLLQGVCDLTDDEIAEVKLTPAGWGLTWRNADIDLGVNELVRGIFGTKAWMREIARKGNRSRSPKKQAASRINGTKGNRPKK